MLALKKGHNCTFQSMQIERYNTKTTYLCWGMAVCRESLRKNFRNEVCGGC